MGSHKLSIQTTLVSGIYRLAAICDANFDWGCQSPVRNESPDMSSPYRLPTMGLSHRFRSVPHVPDRRTVKV